MKRIRIFIISCLIVLLSSCFPESTAVSLEGSWQCEETSEIFLKTTKGTSVFPVYLARDAMYDNKYYIDNFYNMGTGSQLTIMVSGGRTITIETQTVDGIEFAGSAVVSTDYNTIEFVYTADDGGGQIDHVKSTYTR